MDADGNTLAESGGSAPAAAPPSFEQSSPPSEYHDSEPVEQIRDLDKPAYQPGDVRKSLEPEPPADLMRPEPEAPPQPIQPPQSWNKDARDRFAQLPRETQEYLVERETERDRVVRQSQNQAAEAQRRFEAEREQQLRPELERVRAAQELARLPLEVAQQVQQRDAAVKEFGNRYPDLTNAEFADQYHAMLHAQDPQKAAQFEADVKELAAIAQDAERITFRYQQEQARQEAAQQQQHAAWFDAQDREFEQANKEHFSDPQKAAAIRAQAAKYLTETVGIPKQELAQRASACACACYRAISKYECRRPRAILPCG